MPRLRALLFFSVAVLGGLFLEAGPASGRGIAETLAEALRDLPAERIQTGILYDRVLPLSRIEEHDGTLGSKPATLWDWRQIYQEISGASLTAPAWPPLESVVERAGSKAPSGTVEIAVLNFAYDRIRTDALRTGALVLRDGRLLTGKGDPFVVRRAFAAAPLRDHTYRGDEVRFRLDGADYFTNDPAAPRSVAMDFDDGRGFVPSAFGGESLVHYAEAGRKTLRLRLTLADGSSLYAGFLFDVRALRTPTPDDTLHIQATIPYQGVYGTGDAYVYLSDLHTTLTQPVVLLEGFDPDNTMNWDELYALLNRENMLETLRALGYDAVVLNFTDGGDYIQRNAFVATELIQEVRAAIGPETNMALVGASMGGQVGRYALAYMESHGLPHSVRNFISFDSPQEGANIPLGMQYWLWFFAGESSEAAAYLAQLDTPAARQMMVYHHTDPPGTSGESDPLRAGLLNDFAAVGEYPSALRKVAVANGSGTRRNQGFNPGDQIIRWEYGSFLVDLTGNVWAVPAGASQVIFHGIIDYIFLPRNEVYVTVGGTRPYDGAPGGWRDSMAQLGAVDPGYGDIVALYPNHCFIPSVSSLALDTTDLFYDIAGDPEILAHTPFDAVYFPQENQEHVEVTAENAAWLLAEIGQGSSGVADGLRTAPAVARIDPLYPNPASSSARIRFQVPQAGPARLAVYDPAGRQVALLADRTFDPGEWDATWSGAGPRGTRLGPGVYFVRLQGTGYAASRKVLLR